MLTELHLLTLGNEQMQYHIRRSGKAKYVQLRITRDRTLELVVPHAFPVQKAIAYLESKKEWVWQHKNRLQKREQQYTILGKPITVNRNYESDAKKNVLNYSNGNLTITGPSHSKKNTSELFTHFLYYHARKYLPARLRHLAAQHNFTITKISLRSQKTRWGSCSRSGAISLNMELLRFPENVIDYVLIHELCHLRHFNHSKEFWNEVKKIMPDYSQARKVLKQFNPAQ